MYKQSPSRNQRSKGIKVKHVLQICVLLAICFWLVYQVKRSHDKKKEFDEHEILVNRERKDEVIKLGRKDLHPHGEEIVLSNERHDEEVEEVKEATGEEEENKHEEEEQEDNTTEENGNEVSEGGDEELDDHDQENSDAESDQVEDLVDDEKEKEDIDEQESDEKDSENSNDQTGNDSSLRDQDHEGGGRNTHEAREENYKADDASSEVTHDTQISGMINETVGLENSNEHGEVILEQQNTSNGTLESSADQSTPVKMENGESANNGTQLAATSHEVNENTPSNSTVTEMSSDQPEVSNNSTEVREETRHLALPNGNGNIPESTQVHSVVEGKETVRVNSTLQIIAPYLDNSTLVINDTRYDSNSTIYTNSESIDSSSRESVKLSGDTDPSVSLVMSNVSAKAEDNSGSSMTETSGAAEEVKDDATDVTNEGLDETNSETLDAMQHETIDPSNSLISLEEKDVRTDLETLPEVQTEGSNIEDSAAE